MSSADQILPSGEKLKKTICWISDMLKDHPEKNRQQVISEAEVRFDLSPKECDFIDRKVRDKAAECD